MKISILMVRSTTGRTVIHKVFWNDSKARQEVERMRKKQLGMSDTGTFPSYWIDEWEITE